MKALRQANLAEAKSVVSVGVFLLLFAILGSACSPRAASLAQAPQYPATRIDCEAASDQLCDFFTFIGLTYGDHEEDVRRLLGSPDGIDHGDGSDGKKVYPWRRLKYYADPEDRLLGDVSISIDKETGKVRDIHIYSEEGVRLLRSRGVRDEKLNLYGQHIDRIQGEFGRPDEIKSSFHVYDFEDGLGRRGSIDIICYAFHQHRCKEIWLNWYFPLKTLHAVGR